MNPLRRVRRSLRRLRVVGHYSQASFRAATASGRLDFRGGSAFQFRDAETTRYTFHEIFIDRDYAFPGLRGAEVVIDAGANIGLFTWYAIRQSPAARVYCFEADPDTFELLSANVEANQLANVRVYNAAVSDVPASTADFYSSERSGHSSLYPVRGAAHSPRLQVPTVRLSDFILGEAIERVDFLKIDIEGAEYAVLLGDQRLLELDIRSLVAEVDRSPRDSRYSFGGLIEALRACYAVVEVREGSAGSEYPLVRCTERRSAG